MARPIRPISSSSMRRWCACCSSSARMPTTDRGSHSRARSRRCGCRRPASHAPAPRWRDRRSARPARPGRAPAGRPPYSRGRRPAAGSAAPAGWRAPSPPRPRHAHAALIFMSPQSSSRSAWQRNWWTAVSSLRRAAFREPATVGRTLHRSAPSIGVLFRECGRPVDHVNLPSSGGLHRQAAASAGSRAMPSAGASAKVVAVRRQHLARHVGDVGHALAATHPAAQATIDAADRGPATVAAAVRMSRSDRPLHTHKIMPRNLSIHRAVAIALSPQSLWTVSSCCPNARRLHGPVGAAPGAARASRRGRSRHGGDSLAWLPCICSTGCSEARATRSSSPGRRWPGHPAACLPPPSMRGGRGGGCSTSRSN